jgi:23S rRNA pseudouridine1911/1915/1917 synthase
MGVVDRPCVLTLAREYLDRDHTESTNGTLHVINRLDAPATGIVLLARKREAARRLTQQMQVGAVFKQYWVLLDTPPQPPQATCVDWLVPDKRHRKVHVTQSEGPPAREARLHYETVARLARATLVQIKLLTGRKHQIRVQLAHRGFPIIGDRKYGSRTPFGSGIALHARRLDINHPMRCHPLRLTAPAPSPWQDWGLSEETRSHEWLENQA